MSTEYFRTFFSNFLNIISKQDSTLPHNPQKKNLQDQQFVANAMTMQQALETAYNDWNKQKNAQQDSNIAQDAEQDSNRMEDVRGVSGKIPELINNSQSLITSASTDSFSSFKNTTEILPFYYGNPTVDLVKGFIHIYKDWLVLKFF